MDILTVEQDRLDVILFAHTDAARGEHEIVLRQSFGQQCFQLVAIIGCNPDPTDLYRFVLQHRGDSEAVGITDLPRTRYLLRFDQLITRADDADAWFPHHRHRRDTQAGEHAHFRGPEAGSRKDQTFPGSDIYAHRTNILAGGNILFMDNHVVIGHLGGFNRHYRIRARRQGRAGHDAHTIALGHFQL